MTRTQRAVLSSSNRELGAQVPLPHMRPLLSVLLVLVAAGLPLFLVGAVATQLRADLRIDEAGLGAAGAAFSGGGALAAWGAGRLSDRFGPRIVMRAGALLSAVTSTVIATAASSVSILVGLIAFAGVTNALAQCGSNVYLTRAVDERRLGLAFGIKQSGVPLATLIAGIAVPTLASVAGWRSTFVLGAVVGIVAAAVLCAPPVSVERRPKSPQGTGDARRRPMITLAIAAAFGAAAPSALAPFGIDSAVQAGVAVTTAGVLAAIGSVLGLVTRVVSGLRADLRGGRHLIVVSRMLVIGAVMFLVLSINRPVTFALVLPFAYSAAWGWPGLFHLAVVRSNRAAPGAATGVIQTGALSGGLLWPLLFGFVSRDHSYAFMWLTAAVCAGIAAALILVARRMLVTDAERHAVPLLLG